MADNDILQGFQLGFQSSMRMQEFKSQSALRRLQERAAAEGLRMKIEENQLQNQFRAEMTTAAQAMQDSMSEEIMVPMQGQEDLGDMAPPLMPMKNPAPMRRIDAFTQFMLPVITKYQPDKAGPIYNDVMMNEVRAETAESLNAQRESATQVNQARVKEIGERITQLQQGKQGVDPEFVKNITFMERRRGTPFSPDELEGLWQIQTGQKGRAGTSRATQTESEFIAQQLPSARRAERQEIKSKYRSDDELITELKSQYRKIHGDQQADGDELIPVLDPNGKKVRIKRKDLGRALQRGFKEFEG